MCCNSAPPAPDYSQLAAASKESAQIMAGLGREQLDESRRQYDLNRAAMSPVIAAQLGIMNQTKQQGEDYYNYLTQTYRPLERGLVADARNFSTRGAQEQFARQAASDMERQQANEQAQMQRSLMAMGINPNSGRFAGQARAASLINAGQRAGATTNARVQGDALGWARRMDAAGLGRNLPGASQGAYGLAVNSGNAAGANQMAPSSQLLSGMGMGAGTIGQGLGLQMQGLSTIAGLQSNNYNAALNDGGGFMGGLMGLGGQLGAAAIMKSDRRLKENIELVGIHANTGLNLYHFNYKDDPAGRTFCGVMADEVERRFPEAIRYDAGGFMAVDYDTLGIQFKEV